MQSNVFACNNNIREKTNSYFASICQWRGVFTTQMHCSGMMRSTSSFCIIIYFLYSLVYTLMIYGPFDKTKCNLLFSSHTHTHIYIYPRISIHTWSNIRIEVVQRTSVFTVSTFTFFRKLLPNRTSPIGTKSKIIH